jgi:sRNA-binding protein
MATAKKTSKSPGKSLIPVRKPAPKKKAVVAAARPRARAAAKPPAPAVSTVAVPAQAPASPKADKPKKPKLVRDSFTIPKSEYTVLQDLKLRAGMHGTAAKKSEILRAGIKALAAMSDAAFAAALSAVPPVKTGRPSKD